jgi:hypothetical protein
LYEEVKEKLTMTKSKEDGHSQIPERETRTASESALYTLLNRFSRWPMFLATGAACITMVCLFAAGFFEFGKAIAIFFTLIPPHTDTYPPHLLALKMSVRALEYLLLAPLPYLLMLSMVRYVESMAAGEISARVRAELAEVKAFWVSLLIGILGATLVSKALADGNIGYETAISGGIVIALLSGYFYGLKRMASSESKTFSQKEEQEP